MIDCIGITKEKCFTGVTSRWHTKKLKRKMAAQIIGLQWKGQGSRKDPSVCSWAPDWGRGPDPATIL